MDRTRLDASGSQAAQQDRIHRRLHYIGEGPAAFYRDACRLMEGEITLGSRAHLVSHLLREIESALLSVIAPQQEADGFTNEAVERGVLAVLAQKGLVRPFFDQTAVLEHEDPVDHAHRREAMGDQGRRLASGQLSEPLEKLCLGARIQRRRRLVEDQDLGDSESTRRLLRSRGREAEIQDCGKILVSPIRMCHEVHHLLPSNLGR